MQKNSGLDIDLGNECSKNAYNWAKKTFKNRDNQAGQTDKKLDGGFSNLLYFKDSRIGIASDGIGTKIELAERTGIYDTLGFDLVAMVADDLAAAGFEPTNISNIIDVNSLDYDIIDQLMKGLHDAANFAKISISGGEIAELGDRIGGFGERMNFNWCSTAIGSLPSTLQKPINGSTIKAGDAIISLRSRGFRSNGFSLIRRVMERSFGGDWHSEICEDQQTWGEALLMPSLIYSPIVTHLIKNNLELKGVAHITNGGLQNNVHKLLKVKGLGAKLNGLFKPLELMQKVMFLGRISEEQAYLYWNMGNGMLLVLDEKEAEKVLDQIQQYSNFNYDAKVVGTVTAGSNIEVISPYNK